MLTVPAGPIVIYLCLYYCRCFRANEDPQNVRACSFALPRLLHAHAPGPSGAFVTKGRKRLSELRHIQLGADVLRRSWRKCKTPGSVLELYTGRHGLQQGDHRQDGQAAERGCVAHSVSAATKTVAICSIQMSWITVFGAVTAHLVAVAAGLPPHGQRLAPSLSAPRRGGFFGARGLWRLKSRGRQRPLSPCNRITDRRLPASPSDQRRVKMRINCLLNGHHVATRCVARQTSPQECIEFLQMIARKADRWRSPSAQPENSTPALPRMTASSQNFTM